LSVEVKTPEDLRNLARKTRRDLEALRRAWYQWREMRDYQRAKELAELYKGYVTAVATERTGLEISFPGIEALGVTAAAAGGAEKKAEEKKETTEFGGAAPGITLKGSCRTSATNLNPASEAIIGVTCAVTVQKQMPDGSLRPCVGEYQILDQKIHIGLDTIAGKALQLSGDNFGAAWKAPLWPSERKYEAWGEFRLRSTVGAGQDFGTVTSPKITITVAPATPERIKQAEESYQRMGKKAPWQT
jgi:hypothetical protein